MLAQSDVVGINEFRRYSLDCCPWIQEGEVVFGATVSISPETDPEFYIPFTFVQDGRYVTFFTSGGVVGQSYEATFNVSLSYQRRTVCVRFLVQESCGGSVAA